MQYDQLMRHDGVGWPREVSSKDGRLNLQFVGFAEPNNGRGLLQTDVYFDGRLINDNVFRTSYRGLWNYVQFSVDQLMLSDERAQYYFIPTESSGMVLSNEGDVLLQIPAYQVKPKGNYWRSSFIGNFFSQEHLFLLYTNQIVRIDLTSKDAFLHLETGPARLLNAAVQEGDIYFNYYQIEHQERHEFQKQISELTFTPYRQLQQERNRLTRQTNVFTSLKEALQHPTEEIYQLEIETDSSITVLPAPILKMINLTHLTLIETSIREITAEIKALQELERLNLGYNNIPSIPEEIGELTNLKELILPFNKLNALPDSIENLRRLKRLDLMGNPLTATALADIRQRLPNCQITLE